MKAMLAMLAMLSTPQWLLITPCKMHEFTYFHTTCLSAP
jgi:hypothetical protein